MRLPYINRHNKTLNINKTIITIINKSENSATKILNKLSKQIQESENFFTQLLGLDMQNSFAENSSFIDSNLLDVSHDTLMFHRKQILESINIPDIEFTSFLKSILLENAKLTLEDSTLKILDDVFLGKISKKRYKITNEELAKINTFYNGTIVSNKSKLNFGDIFFNEQSNQYYL